MAILAAVLGLPGCSGGVAEVGPTYAVQGRVLLANGRPLTSGRVTFVALDGLRPPASGAIDGEGHFALTTRVEGDGALAGEYKVRIEPDGPAPASKKARKPAFPLKYVDEDSSGLVAQVREASNTLDPFLLK